METEEVKTKQSIEGVARQLLIFKVKGKGEYPHPFEKAKECAEAIQYLIDKGYVVQTGETPKCLDYHVTLKGFEYALFSKEDHALLKIAS